MFEFSVYKNGITYMTYIEYVPFKDIDSMHHAGYRFKLNGKSIKLSDVKALEGLDLHKYDPDNPESATPVQPKKEEVKLSTGAAVEEETRTAPKRGRSKRRVICVEDGTVYGSMSEAAKAYGIDPAAVSYSVNTGKPTKKKDGYHFKAEE